MMGDIQSVKGAVREKSDKGISAAGRPKIGRWTGANRPVHAMSGAGTFEAVDAGSIVRTG
jgi:hypothetical protein